MADGGGGGGGYGFSWNIPAISSATAQNSSTFGAPYIAMNGTTTDAIRSIFSDSKVTYGVLGVLALFGIAFVFRRRK